MNNLWGYNRKKIVEYLRLTTKLPDNEIKKYINLKWYDINLRYDSYRGYNNTESFVYKLANWLNQFDTVFERKIMLDFISEKLVYVSEKEIYEIIRTIVPDILLPIYKKRYQQKWYQYLCQTIFIGMSDGAHMDLFRYYNELLDNHQVHMEYELADTKCENIIRKIKKNIIIEGCNEINIVLLDDFSGSGIGYFRYENSWKGKMYKSLNSIIKNFSSYKKIKVFFIPYFLTLKAYTYILDCVSKLYHNSVEFMIIPARKVSQIDISKEEECIINKKFNNDLFNDPNYMIGKHEKPYLGFDQTQICFVLYHNTPNNSLPIIWSGENALFKRKNRHKVF